MDEAHKTVIYFGDKLTHLEVSCTPEHQKLSEQQT